MGFVKQNDGAGRSIKSIKDPTQDLSSTLTELKSGNGFAFQGPFSNDANAALGGVEIGQVYYNNSGGLVVRQT